MAKPIPERIIGGAWSSLTDAALRKILALEIVHHGPSAQSDAMRDELERRRWARAEEMMARSSSAPMSASILSTASYWTTVAWQPTSGQPHGPIATMPSSGEAIVLVDGKGFEMPRLVDLGPDGLPPPVLTIGVGGVISEEGLRFVRTGQRDAFERWVYREDVVVPVPRGRAIVVEP